MVAPVEDVSDWQPRPWPDASRLPGRYVTLERLDPSRHGDGLFADATAPSAEAAFTYLPDRPPASRAAFDAWLDAKATTDAAVYHAVVVNDTGRAVGRQSLMRLDPANGVAEVGDIYWGPTLARTPGATEAVFLAARYLFDDLGYRRFEWKCDALNAPSRAAATRFGFRAEGVFAKHKVVKGRNRDTAWFAITDTDWARLRPGFETWLAPENFDADGRQRKRLADVIAAH